MYDVDLGCVLWCRFCRTVYKVLWCDTNLWFSCRLEQCEESIWNHVGVPWMLQKEKKNPLLEGWVGPVPLGGVCGSLVKNPERSSCPCGGFPSISQGQKVDWTWPWKTKAHHMQWVALLGRRRQGLQHDTWHWVSLCVGDVAVVVATADARRKSKGQCYSPREYRRRWTAHRMWGERPWSVGRAWISQDGTYRLSHPMFCK